jgi:hypothetical protein
LKGEKFMDNQIRTESTPPALAQPTTAWMCHRHEELQGQVTDFAAQLAALEGEISRSSALSKALGRVFGWGPTGKLERARFKLSYKREELAQFQSLYLANQPLRTI